MRHNVKLDFFPALPEGCSSFIGPHSTQCLATVWLKAGCIEEGNRFPTKLTPAELLTYSQRDLTYVLCIPTIYNFLNRHF